MPGILVWGDEENCRIEVSALEELDRAVDELTATAATGEPFSIELMVNEDTAISMVVGLDISLVNFYSAKDEPNYSGSIGPWDEDESIVFYYKGHYSEVPKAHFIPISDAREALRYYFQTGRRPPNITWTR